MARISREPTMTWPASTMHGRAAARRDRRDAEDDLAGAGREVVRALPRHDEVVRAGLAVRPTASATRSIPETTRPAEEHQREAQSARGAGALGVGDASLGRGRAAGRLDEPVEHAVDGDDLLIRQALLRAERLGRAEHAEQRDVDVGGDHFVWEATAHLLGAPLARVTPVAGAVSTVDCSVSSSCHLPWIWSCVTTRWSLVTSRNVLRADSIPSYAVIPRTEATTYVRHARESAARLA